MWVAAVVVGRDASLVVGAIVQRWRSLGWRVDVTMEEFLRTNSRAFPAGQTNDGRPGSGMEGGGAGVCSSSTGIPLPSPPAAVSSSAPPSFDPGVPLMKPLMISKVNTVMQLALAAGCVGRVWAEWPDPDAIHALEVVTAGTTAASCMAYAVKFFAEKKIMQ